MGSVDHDQPVLSTDVIERLILQAKEMRPFPMQPLRADDGRAFYLVWTTQDEMFRRLEPGWTFAPVMARGRIIGYEPLPTGDGTPPPPVVYFVDGYL